MKQKFEEIESENVYEATLENIMPNGKVFKESFFQDLKIREESVNKLIEIGYSYTNAESKIINEKTKERKEGIKLLYKRMENKIKMYEANI